MPKITLADLIALALLACVIAVCFSLAEAVNGIFR